MTSPPSPQNSTAGHAKRSVGKPQLSASLLYFSSNPVLRRLLEIALLHRFALSLHALLEHNPRSAIRACADERCGWLFLDPSGRRRWCEMAVCGNRAKARRYAQRQYTQ
jgi:hypothetical protein